MSTSPADPTHEQRSLDSHLPKVLRKALSTPESTEDAGTLPPAAVASDILLREALRVRASDIHLDPQGEQFAIRFRIDGVLHDAAIVPATEGVRVTNQLKTLAGLDPVPSFSPQEARRSHDLEGRELDLRFAAIHCTGGEKLNIRLLERRRVEQRIAELGLSPERRELIDRWLHNLSGMFLVTGPTGSGKTTTLYALLHELRLLKRSIVTIEDPVEYRIDGVTHIEVDEEHGLTLAEGAKAMLRLDPDFLLLGEIRDRESARAAADASASGRVLLGTLHSRDAVGAVTSLRNWGLEDHEISVSLNVVIAQRLVRRLCSNCRRQDEPADSERRWLRGIGLGAPEQVWRPGGCRECLGIGYRGRTGVFEVWHLDEQDYELILNHADERTIRESLAKRGHGFLLADALEKASSGVTSIEELRTMGGFGALAVDPGQFAAYGFPPAEEQAASRTAG